MDEPPKVIWAGLYDWKDYNPGPDEFDSDYDYDKYVRSDIFNNFIDTIRRAAVAFDKYNDKEMARLCKSALEEWDTVNGADAAWEIENAVKAP